MASVVLGIAGAAVGSFVGMPQLGFLLGSALGSYIDQAMQKPTKQEGPRLTDRRVQTSAYGEMIPIIHGSMAVAGNVIWAADLIEESHTEESGGKGGGGPSTETTLYSYFANFAVSLCEGPMHSVSRIWANGRLWYDATAAEAGYTAWQFYPGSETQNPDPTIESFMGTGNVPAYRGQCYIVFSHLPLEAFGNVIPQLQFEVNTAATSTNSVEILGSRALVAASNTPMIAVGSDGAVWQWEFGTTNDLSSHPNPIYRIDPFNGALLSTWNYGTGERFAMLVAISGGRFWGTAAQASQRTLAMITPPTGYTRARNIDNSADEQTPAQMCALGDDLLCMVAGVGTWDKTPIRVSASLIQTILVGSNVGVTSLHWSFATSLDEQYARGATDGTYYYAISQDNPGGPTAYRIYKFLISNLTVSLQAVSPTLPGGESGYMVFHHQGKLYATTSSTVDRWNAATLTHEARLTPSTLCRIVALAEDPRYLVASHKGAAACMIEIASFSVVATFNTPTPLPLAQPIGEIGMDVTTNRLLGFGYNAVWTLFRLKSASLGPEPVALGTVVAAYCERAGLLVDQRDVTQLMPIDLRGALLARQSSAREAIEPLAGAYTFDGVESGAVVKFILRGGSVALNLTDEELAAQGDEVPQISIKRSQDVDLPHTVNVTYYEPNRDYQQGTQYARRFGGFSESNITVEVPCALDSDEAKGIAEAWLYNAWVERQAFTFATSIKYAALEPTDLIALHGFVMRINKRTEDGLTLKFEAVNDASQIYFQPARGVEGSGAGDQTPPAPQPTTAAYLDIPLLRDVDDSPGFYLAANGVPTAGWPGASIYKSNDSGQTFSAYYAITAPSIMGVTSTTLADWQADNNTVDELHTVNVSLNGAISSVTLLAMLNGANHVLIGTEVLQFRDATLIGTNAYRLSGLLRGRLGTEWANGAHTSSDQVVMLTTNVRNTTHPLVELHLPRKYSAITIGHTFESGTQTDFTNHGVRHECYAPIDVGGGQHEPAADDWRINWKRRTRLSDGWLDLIDAPLGEAAENYEVDIMDGVTVKRTIAVTSPTAVYTAAQQTTDFGGVQTSLSVRVYQLSALTGRGYVAVAVLPLVT